MSIFDRWRSLEDPLGEDRSAMARRFLFTFDLDIRYVPSNKIHILDYPGDEIGFNELKFSFKRLAQAHEISDIEVTSKIEDEPAARLVFLFLSDPKLLSTKVTQLTTYTSSLYPIIWILVKEKYYPRTKEKISSIWEPLTNAQYYEVRPSIKIANEKWIGTRFTIGRQDILEIMNDKDIHMTLSLSSEAQQRGSTTL